MKGKERERERERNVITRTVTGQVKQVREKSVGKR